MKESSTSNQENTLLSSETSSTTKLKYTSPKMTLLYDAKLIATGEQTMDESDINGPGVLS